MVRDRPFNLGVVGGYGFLFRSEFFFRTTRELEYFFSPEFNIRLYDKDYFFFLHQNQNLFFGNIGNQNMFLEKNITPLEAKWSFPYDKIKVANGIQQRSYISFFWSGVCVFWQFCKVLKGLSNSRGEIYNISLFYF